MRVYIQQEKTASYGKQFPSDIMSTAFYGFSQLGSDIFFFEGENIDEIPQTKMRKVTHQLLLHMLKKHLDFFLIVGLKFQHQ